MAAIKCPECECFINSFQLKDDNCWSCGGDISVLKTIVEDNKSNEDTTDEINENIISKKTDKQNKKSTDSKSKNKSDIPNDYPVMKFLGKLFNFIALINAITGCIIALFFLIDGNIFGVVGGLLLGLISWALSKFFSESVKILSDIANNIKVIRSNSEYWKK